MVNSRFVNFQSLETKPINSRSGLTWPAFAEFLKRTRNFDCGSIFGCQRLNFFESAGNINSGQIIIYTFFVPDHVPECRAAKEKGRLGEQRLARTHRIWGEECVSCVAIVVSGSVVALVVYVAEQVRPSGKMSHARA